MLKQTTGSGSRATVTKEEMVAPRQCDAWGSLSGGVSGAAVTIATGCGTWRMSLRTVSEVVDLLAVVELFCRLGVEAWIFLSCCSLCVDDRWSTEPLLHVDE